MNKVRILCLRGGGVSAIKYTAKKLNDLNCQTSMNDEEIKKMSEFKYCIWGRSHVKTKP